MTDLVEVLARAANEKMLEMQWKHFNNENAVSLPFNRLPAPWPEIEREKMRAVLSALESAGYRVVPVEPTDAMKACGHDFGWSGVIEGCHEKEGEWAAHLYCSMLAAAPKVTQ